MSLHAIRWALDQRVEKSSAKFVLVAMADCVNAEGGEMLCWPSYAYLARRTGLDAKTVEAGIYRLREAGLIVDTGKRRGETGKVVVYRLNDTENGGVNSTAEGGAEEPNGPANPPKSGAVDPEVNDPVFPANPPKFPVQSPQISGVIPPKTGSRTSKGTSKESGRSRKASGFDPTAIELPDWLDRNDWFMWCKDRKSRGKGITEDAAALQLKKLDEYRAAGFTAIEVIENSIANAYQGLFPPKRQASAAPAVGGKHAGFSGKNYREGVSEDGSFS